MARKSFLLVVMGTLVLFLASISTADVPHMITYSGKVTKPQGGLINGTFQMTFSIYPVNYGKKAMIEFENPFNETYFVKVVDMNGQLIGSATTNNNEVSIDARMMGRGLYYVELQGRNSYSGSFSIE